MKNWLTSVIGKLRNIDKNYSKKNVLIRKKSIKKLSITLTVIYFLKYYLYLSKINDNLKSIEFLLQRFNIKSVFENVNTNIIANSSG